MSDAFSKVNSTRLPRKGDWQALKAMGVVRGPDVDRLFCEAFLPSGWEIVEVHYYWSSLRDQNGVEKASIFYKDAFYDNDAFFDISQ